MYLDLAREEILEPDQVILHKCNDRQKTERKRRRKTEYTGVGGEGLSARA